MSPPPTPAAYEYAGSHEHPVNRVLHAIGIPIICVRRHRRDPRPAGGRRLATDGFHRGRWWLDSPVRGSRHRGEPPGHSRQPEGGARCAPMVAAWGWEIRTPHAPRRATSPK